MTSGEGQGRRGGPLRPVRWPRPARQNGAPAMDDLTLQNFEDQFRAWDDERGEWHLGFLQYLQQNDVQRYNGLFRCLGWPPDDPTLTALRVLLREQFGGCSLKGILAARDVVCHRLHIPAAEAERLTLAAFLTAINTE